MPTWFQTTQIARPDFWDRNPSMSNTNFTANGIAPHVSTVRASFTVPVKRKAWLDMLWLRMGRSNVAGTGSFYQIVATYTPSGGPAAPLIYIFSTSNVAGTFTETVAPALGFLNTGDLLALTTVDASVGGTVDYQASQKVTSFDA